MKNSGLYNSIILISLLISTNIVNSQGLNQIIIEPQNPTINDTIIIISDLSYYGNCEYGLVGYQTNQNDTSVNIFSLYCGYGDSTLCNSVDTFLLYNLAVGEYNLSIEYHQGSVCPISGFDALIAQYDTIISIESSSNIYEIIHDFYFDIYPIPSTGLINISTNIANQEIQTMNMYDINGRKIMIDWSERLITIANARPGLYFLRITLINNQVIYKKVILSESY